MRTIGSSDIPALLGIQRPNTNYPDSPWKVWRRVMDLDTRRDTRSSLRGRILEPSLRRYYVTEYAPTDDVRRGPSIDQPPLVYASDPWMSCRPDLIIFDGDRPRVAEIKTTRDLREEDGWGENDSDQCPASYAAQCAWQMIVTGLRHADVLVYCILTDEIRRYVLTRDPEVDEEILGVVRPWYERHVLGGEAPEPDSSGACSAALAARWNVAGKETREADASEMSLISEALAADNEAKAAKARSDEIKNRLKLAIGESYGLTSDGRKVAIYYPTKESTYRVTKPAGRVLRLL